MGCLLTFALAPSTPPCLGIFGGAAAAAASAAGPPALAPATRASERGFTPGATSGLLLTHAAIR